MKNLMPLAVVVAVTMVGCSSGSQTPSMGVPQNTQRIAQAQLVSPSSQAAKAADNDNCDNNDPNSFRVSPCRVVFNANNPGPTVVKVLNERPGAGPIAEKDGCAAQGIATITHTGRHQFTVTAGATAGACTARFREPHNSDRRDDELALLRVVNKL